MKYLNLGSQKYVVFPISHIVQRETNGTFETYCNLTIYRKESLPIGLTSATEPIHRVCRVCLRIAKANGVE